MSIRPTSDIASTGPLPAGSEVSLALIYVESNGPPSNLTANGLSLVHVSNHRSPRPTRRRLRFPFHPIHHQGIRTRPGIHSRLSLQPHHPAAQASGWPPDLRSRDQTRNLHSEIRAASLMESIDAVPAAPPPRNRAQSRHPLLRAAIVLLVASPLQPLIPKPHP